MRVSSRRWGFSSNSILDDGDPLFHSFGTHVTQITQVRSKGWERRGEGKEGKTQEDSPVSRTRQESILMQGSLLTSQRTSGIRF